VAPSATTWAIVLLLAFMSGLTALLGGVVALRLATNARAIARRPRLARHRSAQRSRGVRDGRPGGRSGRRAMLFAVAFVSALAEPAGALVGLALVQLEPELNAWFIAVAAGAMIVVSVHCSRWPRGSATSLCSASASR
jgi:zinc transporter ZupT